MQINNLNGYDIKYYNITTVLEKKCKHYFFGLVHYEFVSVNRIKYSTNEFLIKSKDKIRHKRPAEYTDTNLC